MRDYKIQMKKDLDGSDANKENLKEEILEIS